MGDARRFDLFAGLIESQFDNRDIRIADVAGGKGYLRAALYGRGYRNVTTWDKRNSNAKGRPGTRWGHFLQDTPDKYDLALGMHPDAATDHIIKYAAKNSIPFIICPCCIMPSAVFYWGEQSFGAWHEHLVKLAKSEGFLVSETKLKMIGRNIVITGIPNNERQLSTFDWKI